MTEKYLQSLQLAVKSLQLADHMTYVTYPIVKDKRLLLKILDGIYETLIHLINSILQHDYLWKKIRLYSDPKDNFQVFANKCAPRFEITQEQITEILNILTIVEKHRKSPLEFARKDKVIIMSDNLKTSVIDIHTIKQYLILTKKMIQKANSGMNKK